MGIVFLKTKRNSQWTETGVASGSGPAGGLARALGLALGVVLRTGDPLPSSC